MELVDKYGNHVDIDESELTAITQLDKLGYDENLDWCCPYISNNGRVEISCNEGDYTIRINDKDIQYDDGIAKTAQGRKIIDMIAQAVMDDEYDPEAEYDMIDVLGYCEECGCRDCPWAKNCEPMQIIMYYMDDDGNKYYDPYQ